MTRYLRETGFRTVIGGVISRKRISSARHALATLLLAPKLLRPGKSQVTIVGILPNKRSQLARYCLVWGIHLVYGPTTVSQVTILACFIGYSPIHRLSVFFVLFYIRYASY